MQILMFLIFSKPLHISDDSRYSYIYSSGIFIPYSGGNYFYSRGGEGEFTFILKTLSLKGGPQGYVHCSVNTTLAIKPSYELKCSRNS